VLYRVTVGRDDYLGTAEEVVAFLARGEGSPSRDPKTYMRRVAARLTEAMSLPPLPVDDAEAFLLALGERRVIRVERADEPLSERVDRKTALGDGPIAFSEGVDPDEVDLDG
jgi:hypothetical protein